MRTVIVIDRGRILNRRRIIIRLLVGMGIDQQKVQTARITKTRQTVTRLNRIAALAADKTRDRKMRIPCRIIFIEIEQHIIIHRQPVRIRLHRRRHIFPRMDHFHERFILHTVLQQLRKIPARRIVVIIMQARRINEVGIKHPKLLRLLIHQINKRLFTAADIQRQRPAAVRSTRQ